MHKISLRWLIFAFYMFLGCFPLVAISYYSVEIYSRSVESITERQLSGLILEVANQIEMQDYTGQRYLALLSDYPDLHESLSQLPSDTALERLRNRLESFRANTGLFDRITLFTTRGNRPISVPSVSTSINLFLPDHEELDLAWQRDYFRSEKISGSHQRVTLYKLIYDFQVPHQPVGLIAADIGIDKIARYLTRLNVGEGIEKTISQSGQNPFLIQPALRGPPDADAGKTRRYAAPVYFLNWSVGLQVPEVVLFKDVNRLIWRNLQFIAVMGLFTAVVAFELIRRTTRPLSEIISGTKQFVAGNLDHRIQVRFGSETSRLAREFNALAKRLKRRKRELAQAKRLASLGLLSARIAHEIRNPLAGIKTSAQVLSSIAHEGLKPATATQDSVHPVTAADKSMVVLPAEDVFAIGEMAQGMTQETDRLNNVVTGLLDFARPRPSKTVGADVAISLSRSLQLVETDIEQKRVSVQNHVQHHTVLADTEQTIQIFINLILNALSAVEPEKGEIRFTSKLMPNGLLVVKISDNGCGIAKEKLGQIFDPFFSLFKKGTGLGLSVAHSLLVQNKIGIDVASREGEGTTMKLSFTTPESSCIQAEESHG